MSEKIDLKNVSIDSDFSLINTVAEMANNVEFTKGYSQLIQGNNNENTYIWNALSAIGQDVSKTIYQNVVNYIDNVANVDTCSVKALKSMCKILGIQNYGILQHIDTIPNEILDLINIFSINKKYLESNKYFNTSLYSELFLRSLNKNLSSHEEDINNAKYLLSSSESNEINVEFGFDNDVYNEFILNAFYTLLSNNIFAKYYNGEDIDSNDKSNYICVNLESYINQLIDGQIGEGKNQDLNLPYRLNVEALQQNLNLPLSFNPFTIADAIDNGTDFITNYDGNERYLILIVLEYRTKEQFIRSDLSGSYSTSENRKYTKFAYYKEKKFIEYLKLVNLYYYNNEINFNTYELNSNLILFNPNFTNNFKVLATEFLSEIKNKNSSNSDKILKQVSEILREICFAIVNIREKIKTQCQKNYMRGTFLLISYIINEYLHNTVKYQYENTDLHRNINNMTRDDIGIQEYDDTTEYFNIKTDSSYLALNSKKTNLEYWKHESNSSGIGIALSKIDDFYLNTLNMKQSVSNVRDFLDIIYELGADKSYIDYRVSSNVVVSEEFDSIKSEDALDDRVSARYADISAYQHTMFLKYNGTEIGWNPYFNWKNETHSSYQIHPYLYNFIEHNNSYIASIKNAFYNDANETLISILLTPQISTHIGKVGNILNIWKDDVIEYSGYRSNYEITEQSKDNNVINVLDHYDSIFYPDAIKEFKLSAEYDETFRELCFCIEHRLNGIDVFNGLRNINNYLIVLNENDVFKKSPFRIYIKEYDNKLSTLTKKIKSGTYTTDEIDELSAEFELFKSTMPKTFYEKWYHFANLSETDAKNVVYNLNKYKSNILNKLSNKNDDIFKYTVDKFGNCIFLYKNYSNCGYNNATYYEKICCPGELWFRFNNHPIGFPIDINTSDNFIKFNNDFLVNRDYNIYDLEQTQDYAYLLIAAGTEYKKSDIVVYKPAINTFLDKDNKGEINTVYSWDVYDNNNAIKHIHSKKEGYEFAGIFQSGNVDVIVAYISCNFNAGNNNIIDIEEFVFPEKSFVAENNHVINFKSEISATLDTEYRVSYANNKYGFVWLSEIETTPFVGSNYIGVNTKITSDDTKIQNIQSDFYGEFYNLSSSTADVINENNSFDMFTQYVTFLEFNKNTTKYSLRYYNLNSDASYIPLYSSLDGFIRIWANAYYNKNDINSLELLGFSFNNIENVEREFENNIYVDEDGNFTADDPSEFVESVARVYQNYNISTLFMTYYNDILSSNNGKYEWTVTLTDSITNENMDKYNCYLYNVDRGVTVPIIIGTLRNPIINYISTLTNFDTYYLNHGTINPSYTNQVVGTPNIFKYNLENDSGSKTVAGVNTNSIFGISTIEFKVNIDKHTATITFNQDSELANSALSNNINDIIIDKNKLVLIINKESLSEFNDYHYMTHHNIWPYSAEYSSSDFASIELSNYNSFNDPALSGMFTTGNVVFKINEESNFGTNMYPETALHSTINNIFRVNSTAFLHLSNSLNLSNTYILELEKPKTIADIIGEVKIDTYSNSNESIRVTEDYLSAIFTTSKYSDNIKQYIRATQDNNNILAIAGYNSNTIERVINYTVTEEDIQDFLKLYVNYSKDPETNEITLYFNYNNLFTSPYLYRRNNGAFSTVFKPNTYKKIKPGENDILDIIIQIKYFNYYGDICGIKDIPILSYKIYNVSDDKPKFIIKNTWMLNSENTEYVSDIKLESLSASLTLSPLDELNDFSKKNDLVYDNYTLSRDIIVYAEGSIYSDATEIKAASFDLIYEFSNDDIEFMESISYGASFVRRDRLIHVVSDGSNFNLAFKIKQGTFINTDGIYKIPIDAINLEAISKTGSKIEYTTIQPTVIKTKIIDLENDNFEQYLGKEDRSGFIESHDDRLIQIFRNRSISAYIDGSTNN